MEATVPRTRVGNMFSTAIRIGVRDCSSATAVAKSMPAVRCQTNGGLSAYRDGVRAYHFQGRNLPRRAGQLITLYRVNGAGIEIRTAITRTDSTGIW